METQLFQATIIAHHKVSLAFDNKFQFGDQFIFQMTLHFCRSQQMIAEFYFGAFFIRCF